MKRLMMFLLALAAGAAFGMTTEEFEKIYNTPVKGAELCWQLYEAYAKGDGVEKNDTLARKWLLAAHRCGKEEAREALAALPWRKSLKVKKPIKAEKVDDFTAREKGAELVRLLLAWREENKVSCMSVKPVTLPKDKMKQVQTLIAEGADLNVVVAADGETAFHTALSVACVCANAELAKMLISAGADPCAGGMVALSACMMPYDNFASAKSGSKPKPAKKKARAGEGTNASTPQEQNSKKMIEFLLKNGLDVNMWTDCGWSVGTMVAVEKSPLTASLLAKKGVNLNVAAKPEECVSEAMSAKRMHYLVSCGFVGEGAMPIYVSVLNMDPTVLGVLLAHGANLSEPLNRKGVTAKELAEEQEKILEEKNDGSPIMLENMRACIQMLKSAAK